MNTEFFTITENDFIDRQGRILFTFKDDDSDIDDVFKFVTKPITLYRDAILRKDLNVFELSEPDKRIKLKCGLRIPIVKEVFRGTRNEHGLYFIFKENVYFMSKKKY